MKLLRVTSERNDGVFSMSLNEGFTLKAHSKIALQSLTFEQLTRTISIGSNNDEVTIYYRKGASIAERKTKLAHNTYNTSNINFLLEDIKNKLNTTLNNNVVPNLTGMEWNVKKNNDNKINIYGNKGIDIVNERFNDEILKNAGFGSDRYSFTKTGYDAFASSENFISRGSGRFYAYNKIGNASIGSFLIGLSTTNPGTLGANNPSLAIINNGIYAEFSTSGGNFNLDCQAVENGVILADKFVISTTGNLKDEHMIGIEINDGKIYYVAIQKVGTNWIRNIIREISYDNNTKLYPYIINVDAKGGATAKTQSRPQIRSYTESPFLLSSGTPSIDDDDILGDPIPRNDPTPTDRQIIFESGALAEFLGFNNATLPNQKALEPNFIADNIFLLNSYNDSFVVILDDMQLDSYDSQEKGRKNILSIVPSAEILETGVVYEPNNPIFIDINNNYDINLSNLRLRVLQRDLSTVNTRGLSVIGLLIKDKDE